MKGNFAWGSYGGFLAGSWRILGGTSASSRLNFGKFSAESRQVLGGPKNFKGCRKDSLREAKRLPGCPKGAEKGAKRRPKAPQNHKKTSLYFQIVFGCPRGCLLKSFAPHFGSSLKPKSLIVQVIFWLRFWMHFWRLLPALLMSFWSLLGGLL